MNLIKNKGFTLLEILVILTLIGILMSFIAPQLLSHPDKARKLEVSAELKTIKNALHLYYLDHQEFPVAASGLDILAKGDAQGNVYLADQPIDPWGLPYELRELSSGELLVVSAGVDKQFGTDDDVTESVRKK
mgnify:CR=1 FL=1